MAGGNGMRILRRFSRLPDSLRGGAFAIGNFDGVHRGHREVITAARRSGATPLGVLLFAPHPQRYFRPDKPLVSLSSLRARLCLLKRLGVEVAVIAPFDARMANRSAADFVGDVLVRQLALKHVAVGYDFAFGRKREGDAETLRRLGEQAGVGVSVVAPVLWHEEACSSTRIRTALARGDMSLAADMLGHCWGMEGIVVKGDGRGRALGFPTANISLGDAAAREAFALPFGIYAARVLVAPPLKSGGGGWREASRGAAPPAKWEDTRHPAAVSIGWRPTFQSEEPVLEAHLLDFDADLYGRRLWVFPTAFLRAEKKFDSLRALQEQMRADCQETRQRLSR